MERARCCNVCPVVSRLFIPEPILSAAAGRALRLGLLANRLQITDKRLDQQQYTPVTSSQCEASVDGKDLGPGELEVSSSL